MFALAAYIGSYAYAIFALGLFQRLAFTPILITTIIWWLIGFWLAFTRKKLIHQTLERLGNDLRALLKKESWWWVIIGLIGCGFVILLIGALGPELQHDALWYHLTLPKLYLQSGRLEFFPGDTFYYSGMPQLIEMLFIPALVFGNEIGAKLIHLGFGLLTLIVVILLSWPRWGIKATLIATLMVIVDLSFSWSSSTANIDLGRSFFELVGVYLFVRWWEKPSIEKLFKAGMVMGLALSTKYLSVASIGVMGILIIIYANKSNKLKSIGLFILGILITSFAWFARAFYYTGNPVYPLFTKFIDNSYAPNPESVWQWVQSPIFLSLDKSLWDQAISPLFVVLLPISFILMRKNKLFSFLSLYALFTFGVWLLLPRTGGTRFLLPYIPIWAIVVSSVFSVESKSLSMPWMQKGLFALVVIIASFNLLVRIKLNEKVLPVLLGKQSKQAYLAKNLNLKTNILDTNKELASFVSDSDLVHVVGRANLYYAPFKVQHASYGNLDEATHVLVYEAQAPDYVNEANLLYSSGSERIRLYKSN